MPFCSKCGKEVPVDANFCPSCGNNLKQVITEQLSPLPSKAYFKKCPYCGGEMEEGIIYGALYYHITTSTKLLRAWSPDRKRIYAYLCKNCGYTMLRVKI